jgi:hypothetical protein
VSGNSWETFTTKFNQHDLNGLQDMLAGANVQTVRDVAQNWQDVHDQLVGKGEGANGGLMKQFSDAVDRVLESWHGAAAERFQKKAQEIIQNFKNGAPYASHTAKTMGETANDLQKAVDKVTGAGDDGWNWSDDFWGEMPWSDQIDDDDLNNALKDGVSTQGILEANKDNLSGHQKKRLEAAVAMETLGTMYVQRSGALKPPTTGGRVEDKIPERDQTNGGDVGAIATPLGMGGGPSGGASGLKVPTRGMKAGSTPKMPTSPSIDTPKHPGISGGVGNLKPKTPPSVGTGLDGLDGGPGSGLKTGGPGVGGGGLPGGGGGPGLQSGGGPGAGGGTGGLSGMPGGGMGGGGAVKPGTGAGGAGARSGMGRAGMPGMGGAAGAGKGGAGGGRGVSSGGAQARQRGGTIGSPGGKVSGGAQGGSGLHRSRGGTASGADGSGGRRPAGMMGGHGAHGGKGEGKGSEGSRPDYLVEDEETWTTERNVAPRVIE